jgi:hypothetical protein
VSNKPESQKNPLLRKGMKESLQLLVELLGFLDLQQVPAILENHQLGIGDLIPHVDPCHAALGKKPGVRYQD